VPGRAPVQEFDERPEMFGTVLARAKLSPLDPWEIDDRRAVVGDIRELDPSVDHAAQPDGGASAVIQSVVAEHQQLRDARTHGGEELAPVPRLASVHRMAAGRTMAPDTPDLARMALARRSSAVMAGRSVPRRTGSERSKGPPRHSARISGSDCAHNPAKCPQHIALGAAHMGRKAAQIVTRGGW